MKRLFPPAPSSGGSPKSSAPGRGGVWRPETSHTSHFTRRVVAGFTLIELLVVVAVIAILAGLTLTIMGGVQRKSASSRAVAEVASVAAAIDSYYLDNGSYPPMDPGTNRSTEALYAALCPAGAGKVYLEPKASMVQTNGARRSFIDPWGSGYKYSTNPTEIRNAGSFDFWSEAGTAGTTTDDVRN